MCVLTIETWNHQLGHCNTHTIIDMAHNKVVKDILINLFSPLKCDHCILEKQTHSSVPKVWKRVRATIPLEYVYIDLCGPMPIVSCFRCLYFIDVINDHFSYTWSLPLKRTSDIALIFCDWHCAIEKCSSHTLKTIITDNGELVHQENVISLENGLEIA